MLSIYVGRVDEPPSVKVSLVLTSPTAGCYNNMFVSLIGEWISSHFANYSYTTVILLDICHNSSATICI